MLWLAVTTLEKLERVPVRFWVNALLAAAALVVAFIFIRYAAQMSKLLLSLIIFLLVTVVGFQWVFERNEPRFMTPYINKVAPWFPSKLEYRG